MTEMQLNQAGRYRVLFTETLGLTTYLISRLCGVRVFYLSKSLLLRKLIYLLPFDGAVVSASTLSEGDLSRTNGVRRRSYERALATARKISQDFVHFNQVGKRAFRVDMELIVDKFLVDTLFWRYMFRDLAGCYAEEHPKCRAAFKFDWIGSEASPMVVLFLGRALASWTAYCFCLFMIPLYGLMFAAYRMKGSSGRPIENAIICELDSPKTLGMYQDLFGRTERVRYYTQPQYLGRFSKKELTRYGIVVHSLERQASTDFARITIMFLWQGVLNVHKLARYGACYFELYGVIARGLLLCADARNSTYFVHEHLFPYKAVRNEFLRAHGNRTVSLTYGPTIDGFHFASAYRYNYDILCASGQLQEETYRLQNAATPVYLKTGSYWVSLHSPKESQVPRTAKLMEFKGKSVCITILASGIQDETRSPEEKLMALVRKLAMHQGLKIIVRPKPVSLPPRYRSFYVNETSGLDNVLLTGGDYELEDFLPVTDLFVTAWSNSAADLCALGADFFCVNVLEDEPFVLWQSAVDGVYIGEESATEKIIGWAFDSPLGERVAHNKRMFELRKALVYHRSNISDYKNNLMTLLHPYLPRESCIDIDATFSRKVGMHD